MIVLYITGGAVLILLLLLLIPVKADLIVKDGVKLTVKYLFVRYTVFPNTFKEDEEVAEADATQSVKRSISRKGILPTVNELVLVVKTAFGRVLWLVKKLKIERLYSRVTVADSDAAQTGIVYGAVCSVVYPAVGFVGTLTDISHCDVLVQADFDEQESHILLDGVFSLRPVFIILAVVSFLYRYIKTKLSNNNNISAQKGSK